MNLLSRVAELLKAQIAGERRATAEIRKFHARLVEGATADEALCGPELSIDQCNALSLLLEEWSGMFSFVPGRTEGLTPLIRLMDWIRTNPSADVLKLYGTAEWGQIVDLRGPVESVLRVRCNVCGHEYVSMGMSGFLDASGYVCSGCGDVFFKSTYDETRPPRCQCGGRYLAGCPNCKRRRNTLVGELSPYEYFAEHRYRERL